ncbi:MAG: glycosyltransferase [Desulfobacteraceae bacterium]|nr:glycosyltransferase [Desulfobacteraceae bacterium]MBC2753785.1 glycosyltransferase [Desulfobacteraceae bacterium]
MIIWIASYPRSGNTLVRLLLHHYWGISVHSHYAEEELARHSALDPLLGCPQRDINLEVLKASNETFYVKTHELPADDAPSLYIVRDGRDALISYAHYKHSAVEAQSCPISPCDFYTSLQDLIVNPGYFGGWSSHCLAWMTRHAPTAVLPFEHIFNAKEPYRVLRTKLQQIGQDPGPPLTDQLPPDFHHLNRIAPDSFRKGKNAGWISEMPDSLHHLFWKHHGAEMNRLDYCRSAAVTIIKTESPQRHARGMEVIGDLRLHLEKLYTDLLNVNRDLDNAKTENYRYREKLEQSAKAHVLCATLNQDLRKEERIIAQQQEELVAKEAVIQALSAIQERPLLYLTKRLVLLVLPVWVRIRLARLLRPKANTIPKIEQFEQYPPRPVTVPRRYRKTSPPSRHPLPIVSVVTPSFNQGHFIEKTVDSVLSQGYPRMEYIVQDGGSDDNTLEVLEKYWPQIACFESIVDKGQSNALNRGFQKCTGDIMAWLNSDDMLLPGAINFVSDFFLRHPEVDVVYGHRINVNREGLEIGRRIMPPHDDDVLRIIDYIPQETLFWRRSIWEKAGGYIDETYQFAMDWELLLRFQAHGATFKRLKRFIGAFRVHKNQKTQKWWDLVGTEEVSRLRRKYNTGRLDHGQIRDKTKTYVNKAEQYHKFLRFGPLKG